MHGVLLITFFVRRSWFSSSRAACVRLRQNLEAGECHCKGDGALHQQLTPVSAFTLGEVALYTPSFLFCKSFLYKVFRQVVFFAEGISELKFYC